LARKQTNAGEDARKKEPLYTVDEDINNYKHCEN
jgi:hypothetical protein